MDPRQLSLLIVDDVEANATALAAYLKAEESEWVIETAMDETDALNKLRTAVKENRAFSVVITDLVMDNDKENGIKLIRSIQAVDPLVMTILYTGYPEYLEGIDPSKLSIFDVIIKADAAQTARQILTRTRSALRYRRWAARISFMRRYFNPDFFETVEADASLLDPRIREVTVAFWDIRGFSALCEQLKEHPELIAEFLREYCDAAAQTIFQYHGLLDKFMGDGVMALFGALEQSEAAQIAAARGAVSTAISLRVRFDCIVQGWLPKWKRRCRERLVSIRLACGIHTGRALVGNLGTDFRDQFTAIGAHVNFAQRLESLAGKDPEADILVSLPTSILIEGGVRLFFTGWLVISNTSQVITRCSG